MKPRAEEPYESGVAPGALRTRLFGGARCQEANCWCHIIVCYIILCYSMLCVILIL